jgi:glycosyltransferase involved in cell wall biosynthesis
MSELNQRVSVVIPTYKRETKYLSRAINSIKNQTYKNSEIVIVDDNPPDSDIRKLVMQFMKQFSNDSDVIYIMNSKSINAATGDYITFLDDDDEYMPEKVEKQLKFMVNHGCDMSFTNLKLVNENKVVVDYREYNSLKSFDKMTLLKYHIMRHLTGTPTFMYKAEKLKEIGGFEDAKMGQEFYLMLKSIEKDLKIRYLADCDVLAYRHSDGGISQGKNKIDGENALNKFKKNYFYLFSLREKMFIQFRHYAVMVIAHRRNKDYFHTLLNCVIMILVSPPDFFNETFRFFAKKIKYRKVEK